MFGNVSGVVDLCNIKSYSNSIDYNQGIIRHIVNEIFTTNEWDRTKGMGTL